MKCNNGGSCWLRLGSGWEEGQSSPAVHPYSNWFCKVDLSEHFKWINTHFGPDCAPSSAPSHVLEADRHHKLLKTVNDEVWGKSWHYDLYRQGFCVIIRNKSNPSLISSLCPCVKLWLITIVLLPSGQKPNLLFIIWLLRWIIQYQTKGKLPNTKSVFSRNWGAASVSSAGSAFPTNCY